MTTSSSGIDTRLFRDVCGNFATGVSVVTMAGESGPRGLTANAISASRSIRRCSSSASTWERPRTR